MPHEVLINAVSSAAVRQTRLAGDCRKDCVAKYDQRFERYMSGELCPSVYQIQCVHMFVDTHIVRIAQRLPDVWCRWRHDGTYSCAV